MREVRKVGKVHEYKITQNSDDQLCRNLFDIKSSAYSGPWLIWPLDNWASHLIGIFQDTTHYQSMLNGPLNWAPI